MMILQIRPMLWELVSALFTTQCNREAIQLHVLQASFPVVRT